MKELLFNTFFLSEGYVVNSILHERNLLRQHPGFINFQQSQPEKPFYHMEEDDDDNIFLIDF